MPALESNPQLLLRAFAETAADLFPIVSERVAWLKTLRNTALTGNVTTIADVLQNLQDFSASGIANDGASTQWIREISAPVVAQLAQAALDVIAADEEAGGPGMAAPGNVRFADFSKSPCILG